jgi:hypothetical protein
LELVEAVLGSTSFPELADANAGSSRRRIAVDRGTEPSLDMTGLFG